MEIPMAGRDPSAQGEKCTVCGAPADRKVEEVIPASEYRDFGFAKAPPRHPWTAYLCAGHFNAVMFHPLYRQRQGVSVAPWPENT